MRQGMAAIAIAVALSVPSAAASLSDRIHSDILGEKLHDNTESKEGQLPMNESSGSWSENAELPSTALMHRVLAVEDAEMCDELAIASRDAETAVNEAVGQLIRLMGEIDLQSSGSRAVEIHSLLNGIVVSFQFQDLHKQRLEHIADRLRQRALAARNGPEALAEYLRTSPTEVNRRRQALFFEASVESSHVDDTTLFEAA